ncbi:outer membrane protein transport protein [Enterovibrio makurazakiensis]|uniref:Outer membrane protein transport protein n=1 Tax=Enterovibrio gelatinilyticus TaxID=2899819 RepID=A0ABT5QU93_9GAMM|nr:outer membrane protein transport protein [Enterovibrio sp. ZSDZ42]MDD1791566.1 outer membrane protein transport protein [Enterovibrio sp. ZSDZ42]
MLVTHYPSIQRSVNKRTITVLVAASSIIASTLCISSANAAGYQIAFDSVSGLGRSYAGEAAIGDTAAAMGRNPALMSLFEQAELSGALIYFDGSIDVKGGSDAFSSNDTVPAQFVPSTYYVHPIDEKIAVGLGVYSNYGLGTDLKDDFAAGDIGGDTSLLSVNFNPAVSYRINPMLSLGGGVSLIYATGEVNRHYGASGGNFNKNSSDKLLSWDADDWAFGWNVGALVELDENNRFGLAYRAGVDLELSGDFIDHTVGFVAIPGGGSADSVSNVPLPATIEFSGFHQLNNTLAVHYSALWTQWSDYTEFKASGAGCSINGGTCFVKPEKYDDSWRWALGATYQLNQAVTLRAGVALDEKAGATTLSIPDQDALWLSTGLNYTYSPEWSFDVGLAYMDRSKETFKETSLFVGEQEYQTKGYLVIVGAQANYRF